MQEAVPRPAAAQPPAAEAGAKAVSRQAASNMSSTLFGVGLFSHDTAPPAHPSTPGASGSPPLSASPQASPAQPAAPPKPAASHLKNPFASPSVPIGGSPADVLEAANPAVATTSPAMAGPGAEPVGPAGTVVLQEQGEPAGEPSAAGRTVVLPDGTAIAIQGNEEEAGGPDGPQHLKTQMGVALPGIAPLQAGGAAARPAPAPAVGPETWWEDPPPEPAAPVSKGLPKLVVVFLVTSVVLLAAAAGYAIFANGGQMVTARLVAGELGEQLELRCESCADGTVIRLGSATATVALGVARLTPSEPIPVGDNTLVVGVEAPDGDTEQVELRLPTVYYRLRPDLATLQEEPPHVLIHVHAVPGSTVSIAGTNVPLTAQGLGAYALDLGRQLHGSARKVRHVEHSLPFVVTPPMAQPFTDSIQLRVPVTPLVLEAPGTDSITDTQRFQLAGRTAKGSEVTVAGSELKVDSTGRFAQMMSIDSVGETTVTVKARKAGLAPRFVDFRLKRVESLRAEAKRLSKLAEPFSSADSMSPNSVGQAVTVAGTVEEARQDGGRLVLLVQPSSGCEGNACLVRLLYGGLKRPKKGHKIQAFGTLVGHVGSAPSAIAEIEVSLLL